MKVSFLLMFSTCSLVKKDALNNVGHWIDSVADCLCCKTRLFILIVDAFPAALIGKATACRTDSGAGSGWKQKARRTRAEKQIKVATEHGDQQAGWRTRSISGGPEQKYGHVFARGLVAPAYLSA